jgi:hypothetical protein
VATGELNFLSLPQIRLLLTAILTGEGMITIKTAYSFKASILKCIKHESIPCFTWGWNVATRALQEIRRQRVGWINVARYMVQGRAAVFTVMKLRVQ